MGSYQLRLIPSLVGLRLRPPVEERAGSDGCGQLHEREAALGDGLVEVVNCFEVAIDERLVDEGP